MAEKRILITGSSLQAAPSCSTEKDWAKELWERGYKVVPYPGFDRKATVRLAQMEGAVLVYDDAQYLIVDTMGSGFTDRLAKMEVKLEAPRLAKESFCELYGASRKDLKQDFKNRQRHHNRKL